MDSVAKTSWHTPRTGASTDELLIIDPHKRTVDWLALQEGEYQPSKQSRVIDLGPTQLAEQISWPPTHTH